MRYFWHLDDCFWCVCGWGGVGVGLCNVWVPHARGHDVLVLGVPIFERHDPFKRM